ncbi:endonuclease III [Bartonella alsatica]|uniref:Endonuclease III n=4 Tax=Bartonella TaxID=773 RepID=J0YJ45_9HYPH|nr:endonuclease III [Bartonella alsatica]EJF74523.1 endonuclease III [Bartonella alsatica IBS 382]QLC52116.1 endonuclease III [Bartonella alsatica]
MTQRTIKLSKTRISSGMLYSKDAIEEIFHRFSVQRPIPKSDLIYTNVFTLLVAVVLSAQATDTSVNKATKELFRLADRPEKMVALGEEEIGRHIRTIGLWRAKARNVYALCNFLINHYSGQVPDKREALMALPGVGRKTANVVLNVAFGQPTLAVDTHIFRLANRLGLAPGKTPEIVEEKLLKIIPIHYLRHAHHWLILHGRYICQARKAQCTRCIIADLCKAAIKTNTIPAPLVEVQDNGPPIFF